jgi:hypothetical protein
MAGDGASAFASGGHVAVHSLDGNGPRSCRDDANLLPGQVRLLVAWRTLG